MKLPGSEKLEIIRLVEQSHLPARRTLEMLGIRPSTFYRWYDRYRAGGPEALEDKPSRPDRVWNRIPDDVRERIVAMALDVPELSPRELATRFTDTENYFVSESSVYRLLKAHDLITSPAFVVIKAADEFKDKTTAPNQLWQTDFTYLKVIGWGWFYLSTILDDFSRYIIAWKLCTTMRATDVTDTLQLALTASGCASARVVHKPQLLSDNGSSYVSGDLAEWLEEQGMGHVRGAPNHPQTQGKIERWHQTLKNRILLENYYLPGDLKAHIGASSSTTIIVAITRACRTSRPPTSTSDEVKPSCSNAKGSNETPSDTDDCCTSAKPPKLKQKPSQSLPSRKPQTVAKHLTTDTSRSSHTRSVLARFLERFSGYGIFTDVIRLMALRTSSRSAALAGVSTRPSRTMLRRRDLSDWNIWENLPREPQSNKKCGPNRVL